jgi:hypothetical protein
LTIYGLDRRSSAGGPSSPYCDDDTGGSKHTEDDAAAVASLWLDWGREYESLDSVLFRVPSEDGLAGRFRRQIADAADDELWLIGEAASRSWRSSEPSSGVRTSTRSVRSSWRTS